MKTRVGIGLITALMCLLLPYISRLPYGLDWVAQYQPNGGYFSAGMIFFLAFAILPSIFTFLSALVSKAPCYLPVLLSSFTAFGILAICHHANDLAADAQSGLTLIFIPMFAAGGAIFSGIIGFGIQELWVKPKKVAEQGAASDR